MLFQRIQSKLDTWMEEEGAGSESRLVINCLFSATCSIAEQTVIEQRKLKERFNDLSNG